MFMSCICVFLVYATSSYAHDDVVVAGFCEMLTGRFVVQFVKQSARFFLYFFWPHLTLVTFSFGKEFYFVLFFGNMYLCNTQTYTICSTYEHMYICML